MSELEQHLKYHDWYYCYSDDHSVWLAGEAHIKKIKKMLGECEDKVKAKELWLKYAPKKFKMLKELI